MIGAGFVSVAILVALTVLEPVAAVEEDLATIEELPDVEIDDGHPRGRVGTSAHQRPDHRRHVEADNRLR